VSRKAGPQCIVCNRLEGVLFKLPSTGQLIMLCKTCQKDRWQLAAAERKAKAAE
jgi:hypothetical protein